MFRLVRERGFEINGSAAVTRAPYPLLSLWLAARTEAAIIVSFSSRKESNHCTLVMIAISRLIILLFCNEVCRLISWFAPRDFYRTLYLRLTTKVISLVSPISTSVCGVLYFSRSKVADKRRSITGRVICPVLQQFTTHLMGVFAVSQRLSFSDKPLRHDTSETLNARAGKQKSLFKIS